MESTENMATRLKRVDMHEFFLNKIVCAMEEKRYIEASWLIYSCLENRYFRTIEKIKSQCIYSKGKCKKPKNELALRTKVTCIQRLFESNCECFRISFSDDLFEKTKKWIKKRNNLMHNLLQLDYYENMDKEFENISIEGLEILRVTYVACTRFRERFYDRDYTFIFPSEAMEKCSCNNNKNSNSLEEEQEE